MKQIHLTQGKLALMDDADYDELARYRWCAQRDGRRWYAVRGVRVAEGKPGLVLMHRQITGAIPGQDVDHRDGDGLNNQRENLRLCNRSQNHRNRHDKRTGCSSRFKGVVWHKQRGKWRAQIVVNRKTIHLGHFEVEEDAARAYNAAAVEQFGAFACLNVIEE